MYFKYKGCLIELTPEGVTPFIVVVPSDGESPVHQEPTYSLSEAVNYINAQEAYKEKGNK